MTKTFDAIKLEDKLEESLEELLDDSNMNMNNVSQYYPGLVLTRDFSNCEMRQVLIHKMTRKQVMDDS